MSLEIRAANLGDPALQAMVSAHRAHAFASTPPENVFALDTQGLAEPGLEVFAAQRRGALVGMGALRPLDADNGELKSVHVAETARGEGIARQLVLFLIDRANGLGLKHLWLETGSMPAYAPSRALYTAAGFTVCGAFGDYPDHPGSTFMTKAL